MSDRSGAKRNETPRVVGNGARAAERINEAKWALVLALILEEKSNFREIGRRAGLHERTIRRLYHKGLPSLPWGATPMKVLHERERVRARALRAEIHEDPNDSTPFSAEERIRIEAQIEAVTPAERASAKRDVLEARTAEARMVRLARGNVLALSGAAVGLLGPAKRIAGALAKQTELAVNGNKLEPLEGMRVLRQMVGFVKDLVETGERAMQMERLLLGDPTGGGKIMATAATMTDDEVMTELGNASKIFTSLEARGLRVIRGGKGAAVDPVVATEPEETNGVHTNGTNGTTNGGGVVFDASLSHATIVSTPAAERATTEVVDEDAEPATEDDDGDPEG